MSDHEHEHGVSMDTDAEMHHVEDFQVASPDPEATEERPAPGVPDENVPAERTKRKPKPTEPLAREPGKSLFPVSRMQRVLKADKARLFHHATLRKANGSGNE
ncbi:uncharacterized protein PHACADRAFT_180595 [Phanerochaete carnosa HHB-10118-sp]|uniref:Uncharacterized protein n=1 Tax=Phanerochaete carnosa (strain HHB-10118-sp) TaxID=650164 RepID=K5VEN1_PHACS|nr:uncharacterized protein PHACADRAFT_180595 [Phanerochaete carnosa HHB-10118-sp]EKM61481.1 hypothetical protein PHACADRAFT_180595 [Phanerochaete carnosa HHB-10118-sp]